MRTRRGGGAWTALGTAAGAGMLLGASPALADDAGDASSVTVTGRAAAPLDRSTGLATQPTTVQDTPQAVSVIGPEQLREQQLTTLAQALRQVPGITLAIGEGGTLSGDQFKIRGQDANNDVYVDGLRDFGVYTRDSFDYQEVQVLKGPSGALFGRGTTGGVINTLTKAPGTMDEVSAFASAGSGENYRGALDINHALSGSVAVRLNLMLNDAHVADRDLVRSRRWGVAAAAGLGIGKPTTATVNYLHQHDDRIPDYGITIVQPPGSLYARPASSYDVGVDRSTFLGYAADRDRTDADIFTVRLAHTPASWLTLSSDSRIGVYSRYFQYTTVDRCDQTAATFFCANKLFDNDPATIPNAFIGGSGPYSQNAWGAQNVSVARADWRAGRFRSQLIAGVDVSYQKNDKTFSAYTLPPGIPARTLIPRNLLAPDHALPAGYSVFLPSPANMTCVGTAACTTTALGGAPVLTNATAATVLRSRGDSTDVGLFLTGQLWLDDRWSLLGSLRWDRYKVDLDTLTVTGAPSSLASTSDLLNPRVALIYEPDEGTTVYASWGRSANPQGTAVVGSATALALATADLEPERNETFEVGAKVTPLQRLSATVSVFEVRKNDAKQIDPSTGVIPTQSGQRQRIRGVELGVSGRLTDAWSVDAAYTFLDAKIVEDLSCSGAAPVVCKPNPFTIGQPVTFVPKHAASLWSTYALDGVLMGLEVGAGVTYQSKLKLGYTIAGTAPNPTGLAKIAEVPESVSVDAMVSYETGRWRLAVNAFNLTDRLNYTSVFSNRAVPAPGRGFVVSLGARF